MVHAHNNIENVKSTLAKLRSNVESFHRIAYEEALLLCQSVGIEESTPRVTSRQQHRQNIPSDNSREYYKRTTTIPLLDHLISELNVRFDASSSQLVLEFMQLLPSELIKILQVLVVLTAKPCWSFMMMICPQADLLKLSFTCGKTTGTVRSI